MKIDFHFERVQQLAVRAGFSKEAVRIISYASQFTDDNTVSNNILDWDNKIVYQNNISQIKDHLSPLSSSDMKMGVYIPFHFLPGEVGAADRRVDGRVHPLCVTPRSHICEMVMDAALESGDLYWIGIAIHACADSWSHQNFVGLWDSFNELGHFLPNIGHADAMEDPDTCSLVWRDTRLLDSVVVNRDRFDDAAKWISKKLAQSYPKLVEVHDSNLISCALNYDPEEWFKAATTVDKEHGCIMANNNFYDSDWYKFQEAVKTHAQFVKFHIAGKVDVSTW